jgi:hypothetical protein
MPKKPRDFSKGLIYSIVCKTDETLIYVGSTTEFTKRKSQHKTVCNNEKSENHNLQVYVMIRTNGGWGNFDMKPIKEFPCESKIQLVIEEERIRKEMQANLNTKRAYRSPEERRKYYEEHKDELKTYREENKEKINEKGRKYYEEHKDEKRKYYEAHKDEIRTYREEHKDKINKNSQKNYEKHKDKKRKYYEEHKDEIKQRRERKKVANLSIAEKT